MNTGIRYSVEWIKIDGTGHNGRYSNIKSKERALDIFQHTIESRPNFVVLLLEGDVIVQQG